MIGRVVRGQVHNLQLHAICHPVTLFVVIHLCPIFCHFLICDLHSSCDGSPCASVSGRSNHETQHNSASSGICARRKGFRRCWFVDVGLRLIRIPSVLVLRWPGTHDVDFLLVELHAPTEIAISRVMSSRFSHAFRSSNRASAFACDTALFPDVYGVVHAFTHA